MIFFCYFKDLSFLFWNNPLVDCKVLDVPVNLIGLRSLASQWRAAFVLCLRQESARNEKVTERWEKVVMFIQDFRKGFYDAVQHQV